MGSQGCRAVVTAGAENEVVERVVVGVGTENGVVERVVVELVEEQCNSGSSREPRVLQLSEVSGRKKRKRQKSEIE